VKAARVSFTDTIAHTQVATETKTGTTVSLLGDATDFEPPFAFAAMPAMDHDRMLERCWHGTSIIQ
jgi:hypothetical protein